MHTARRPTDLLIVVPNYGHSAIGVERPPLTPITNYNCSLHYYSSTWCVFESFSYLNRVHIICMTYFELNPFRIYIAKHRLL